MSEDQSIHPEPDPMSPDSEPAKDSESGSDISIETPSTETPLNVDPQENLETSAESVVSEVNAETPSPEVRSPVTNEPATAMASFNDNEGPQTVASPEEATSIEAQPVNADKDEAASVIDAVESVEAAGPAVGAPLEDAPADADDWDTTASTREADPQVTSEYSDADAPPSEPIDEVPEAPSEAPSEPSVSTRRRSGKRRSPKRGGAPQPEPDSENVGRLGQLKQRLQPLLPVLRWIWKKLIRPVWRQLVVPLWGKGLDVLRSVLPGPLKQLSNRVLTAIILVLVVSGWGLFHTAAPGPGATDTERLAPPEVALTEPPPPPTDAPSVEDEPLDNALTEESETEAALDEPQESEPSEMELTPSEEAVQAEIAKALLMEEAPPPASDVVEDVVSEPDPIPPPIVLTADQKRVLDIQTQVDGLVDQYSSTLIPAVKVDIAADRLVVEVSDDWYQLKEAEQDQVGRDMLARSQRLRFQDLEFRDQRGVLVARDPVVGPNIIVLHRTLRSLTVAS